MSFLGLCAEQESAIHCGKTEMVLRIAAGVPGSPGAIHWVQQDRQGAVAAAVPDGAVVTDFLPSRVHPIDS